MGLMTHAQRKRRAWLFGMWLGCLMIQPDAWATTPKHLKGAHHRARLQGASRKLHKRTSPPASTAPTETTSKPPGADQAVEAVEPVEAVQAVETVEAVDASAAAPLQDGKTMAPQAPAEPRLDWRKRTSQWLGHMHAAAVHLPIAWVLMWGLIDAAGLWRNKAHLLSCGPWLGALAILSFAPAVASGLLRFDELASAAADPHAMDPALVHRNLMWLGLALCAITYGARPKTIDARRTLWRIVYTMLLAACIGVVAYSAHLGGTLVYGEEFLSF